MKISKPLIAGGVALAFALPAFADSDSAPCLRRKA